MDIRKLIGTRMLCYDGGFGTALIRRGLQGGELTERWNISHPEDVIAVHQSYLEAGADIVLANTFGAHKFHYEPQEQEAVIRAGIANAKEAVKRSGKDAAVALDIGSCGQLLYPMGSLMFEDAIEMFARMVQIGADEGVDLIQIETMNDEYELKAAVIAAKENASVPVFATAVFDQGCHMLTGTPPEAAAALLEGLGCDVIGVNCGVGPEHAKEAVRRIAENTSLPVMAKPNAGLAEVINGETVYKVDPETFGEEMDAIMEIPGVCIVGGCCGTTDEHIRRMAERAKKHQPVFPHPCEKILATSYTHVLELGNEPVELGDPMKPESDEELAQALQEEDMDTVTELAEEAIDDDADLVAVNVALEGTDEADLIRQAFAEIQGLYDTPMMAVTSDPGAAEAALRVYNGKAVLRCVFTDVQQAQKIFSAVKKYGAVTVTKTGPDTLSAEEILSAAAGAGVSRKEVRINEPELFEGTD